MLDFEIDDLDATALGISALLMLLVLGSMFGFIPTFGDWVAVPLWMKIAFGILTGPVTYFIVVWQKNR